jgi:hypothetical protein
VTVTARQLNRATLHRQLLLRREPIDVPGAVRRIVALQAQEPASPYLALWNRVEAFDPATLDRAFADRALLKATLMRITLHAVDVGDYPAFHEAMQPTLRASRLNDRRFAVAGLPVSAADALVPEVLAFTATPRSNAEVEAWLDERLGVLPRPGLWWAMRTYGPLSHAPTGGPWSFGLRPAYVAAPELPRVGDPEAALVTLIRRYLEGFGPASIADIARFALVVRARVRAALATMADAVRELDGPDGATLYDVPDGPLPPEEVEAPPRLLPMWDSVLLAYDDRGRVIPEAYRKLVIRANGDVLPTLLVDGHVAGAWRPLDGGIEATTFHRLPPEAWHPLEVEAQGLLALLAGRDPTVYRRYGRWWSDLPGAEVRVLGRTGQP